MSAHLSEPGHCFIASPGSVDLLLEQALSNLPLQPEGEPSDRGNFVVLGMLVVNGYQLGRDGHPCSSNPNPVGVLADAWLRGWEEGAAVRAWILANQAPPQLSAP